MQFNSLTYLFGFLPVVVLGWALLRRTRFGNAFVAVASLFFYSLSAVWYLAPLFATALLDYYVGQRVDAAKAEGPKRRLTAFSIVANLGLLSYFKYAPWLTSKLAPIAAQFGVVVPMVTVGLPPAISFYTFQSMSYTIDIYRGEFRPYRSVVDYLSFVTFFPHLVAGPIMRARDLLPQLARDRALPSAEQVSTALFLILFGLFQKVVVADNVATVVNAVSSAVRPGAPPLAPGMGLLFAYSFAIQIYCDFAAYTSIARGSARLLNVELMRNFATPYFSLGPSEFWQRWHISLSTWLRDYLYIPLGGNRGGTLRTYRNLMLTMLLGGLWHGAGILFLAWGFWHGLLLIAYRVVPVDRYLARLGAAGKIAAAVLFFHLVCVGWVFFRSTVAQVPAIFASAGQTWRVLLAPASHPEFFSSLSMIALFWLPMLAIDFVCWRSDRDPSDVIAGASPFWKAASALALVYAIIFFGKRQANEFIYFAF